MSGGGYCVPTECITGSRPGTLYFCDINEAQQPIAPRTVRQSRRRQGWALSGRSLRATAVATATGPAALQRQPTQHWQRTATAGGATSQRPPRCTSQAHAVACSPRTRARTPPGCGQIMSPRPLRRCMVQRPPPSASQLNSCRHLQLFYIRHHTGVPPKAGRWPFFSLSAASSEEGG